MKPSHTAFSFLALLALMVWSAPAHGQRIGASDQPIYISSERSEITETQGIWIGNVRIVQGKAILVADRVVGDLDGNGDIIQITAIGNVRYSDGEQAISGARGVYEEKSKTLTMTQDVIVTQGRNVLTAAKVVYWIDTGQVILSPAAGKRVRGIFYTNSDVTLN